MFKLHLYMFKMFQAQSFFPTEIQPYRIHCSPLLLHWEIVLSYHHISRQAAPQPVHSLEVEEFFHTSPTNTQQFGCCLAPAYRFNPVYSSKLHDALKLGWEDLALAL